MTVLQLRPIAGATKGSQCPGTVLTADGRTLTATDTTTGASVRITPATLYRYDCDQRTTTPTGKKEQPRSVQGMAALDADGLVLLDLPGEWHGPDVDAFVTKSGIPVLDARFQPAARVRGTLASRAPGWQRMRGMPIPALRKWRKTIAMCAGVVGLGFMAYLATLGLWGVWRGLSAFGAMLLDLLHAKWLAVMFSPALLVMGPVLKRFHRRRVERGTILGPHGGLNLRGEPDGRISVTHSGEVLAEYRIGASPGQAFSLLLYHYENLTGLFILDITGRALHHLPGHWSPEHTHNFAERHILSLATHRITREEYLDLTKSAREATP
ncbi:hypothetical protein [Nonomuraea sp. NPDC002799]